MSALLSSITCGIFAWCSGQKNGLRDQGQPLRTEQSLEMVWYFDRALVRDCAIWSSLATKTRMILLNVCWQREESYLYV